MSQTTPAVPDTGRRNVALLAICMACNQTCMVLIMTIAALAGQAIAVDKSLSTLPLACLFVGILVSTVPASLFMRRFGRRAGFALGSLVGVAGGVIAAVAVWQGILSLLALGLALYGVAASTANYYRFAAADVSAPEFKSRAISYVLLGGVVAAVAGPTLAGETRDLFTPFSFAGGFLAVALLSFFIIPVLLMVRFPASETAAARKAVSSGRPLREIARQPAFLVAAIGAAIGYGAMNLIMVSTPLSMQGCGFAFTESASVIQWHVLGMYVPSFFTGNLIKRFGVAPIMSLGAALILATSVVNLMGQSYWHFWIALVLLGIGWNFLFVGGTSLLTETYRPEEKAKVQACNDFLVFGTTAATALTSGAAMSTWGWDALNIGVMAPITVVLAGSLWLLLRRPAAKA